LHECLLTSVFNNNGKLYSASNHHVVALMVILYFISGYDSY